VTAPLRLTRAQILAYRRRVGALDERLPRGARSLRAAAWAGLQDSMPRAALLSIHARVERTRPETLFDPALVQLWGPRYSAYAVPARDVAIFTLGRFPDSPKTRRVAVELAERLRAFMGDARMSYGEAGRGIGVDPNQLRYAATTGTILMRWEGARAPVIWMVPPPDVDPTVARLELARRYLHVYGPSTAASFSKWSSVGARQAIAVFDALGDELVPVRTPIGDAWLLERDEPAARAAAGPAAPVRLLPSGDAFTLGEDRALVVPDPDLRRRLWTPRVWPGALLVNGDIAGTWRRADELVTVEAWRRPSKATRAAVEAEAASLPLPGLQRPISVVWEAR
jgi:hypothetical protein